MSKISKNYGWLNTRPNSSKTLLERAKREVPGFTDHIPKFEEQIAIKSYSSSTVFSYSRCIAQISLYFKKSPLDLDPDKINSYLYFLKSNTDLSDTFFNHTVYGLRFFYRVYDLEDHAIRLPGMKNNRKLPVVFSQEELRILFKAPQRLKQRVLLCLIYSAGLRLSEVCKLKITDIDFDRKQIHVRESKNNLRQPEWKKIKYSRMQIAKEKLNYNPNLCPHCKIESLITIKIIDPERGPPLNVFRLFKRQDLSQVKHRGHCL